MVLAIPVETKDMNAAVCPSFGRAPYFLLYNSEEKNSSVIDNAAQTLVDNKVDALLTPRCGENAAEVLKAANIVLYKSAPGSAMENITLFAEGKLPVLEEIHAGFHKHGA